MSADPTNRQRHAPRGDIQGLRAVAVLTVVLSHARVPGFSGGYVGVDVFFVISGFLITGILVRRLAATGRVSILDFYARRARRILPAATLVLVAVTIASRLAFGFIRLAEVLRDVVWAALFGANLRFAAKNADYFAADGFRSPVQHFWSLAVEEQFYLVWPVVILLLARGVRRAGGRRVVPWLATAMLLACAASLLWSVHHTRVDPVTAYFSTLTRAWELGAGAGLALLANRVARLDRRLLAGFGLVGLVLIGVAVVAFDDATPFPGIAAALPVLGSVLVLAGGLGSRGASTRRRGAAIVLDRAPMRWVGDVSYSLYLWHWPLLMIPTMTLGRALAPWEAAGLVAAAVVLAGLSFRWVETPFRDGIAWSRGLRSLALWPAAIAITAGTVAVVGLTLPETAAGSQRLDAAQHSDRVDLLAAVAHAVRRARDGEALPDPLVPAPLELAGDHWQLPSRCWASASETSHSVCTFGDATATRTMVLLGDSHLGVWVDPISDLAKRRHWKVALLLKTGCPPYATVMWQRANARVFTECEAFKEWSLAQVRRLHPDRIVLAGKTMLALADPASGRRLSGDKGPAGREPVRRGMRTTLQRLSHDTRDLVVIGDTNKLRRSAVDCLGERGATLGTCLHDVHPELALRNRLWEREVHAQGGRFVDPAPWLCAAHACPLVVGNVVVYADDNHLTRTYAAALEPELDSALFLTRR